MGLVRNKRDALVEQLAMLESSKAAVAVAEGEGSGGAAEIDEAIRATERKIAAEDEKAAAWKMENVRRKHNYIPFVVNLFRMLAEKNLLKPMIDKAQKN
jgi:ubiquitin carboxyl-terminal hydrolase L5